jgi:hypothetical protein
MARKRKTHRPSDPAAIARRRLAHREAARSPASWGLDKAALSLPANADVESKPGPGGKPVRARRGDVFDLFAVRGRMSQSALDAVRRLQSDIAVLHRTQSSGGDFTPRIDRSRPTDPFAGVRIAAGERIAAVLALAGAASAQLLSALIEADIVLGRPDRWRQVVETASGERLADAQAAVLRSACENLAGAYAAIDRQTRRRGEAASRDAVAPGGRR